MAAVILTAILLVGLILTFMISSFLFNPVFSSSNATSNLSLQISKASPKLEKTPTTGIIIARDSSFPENKNFFVPPNLTIEGNTTVIWTNNDTVVHTATSGNPDEGPSGIFDSSLIESNKQFNHTFTKVGKYSYYCTLHPFMTGKLTVTKQIKPLVTILSPEELPSEMNVTIAKGSSFPNNKKFYVPPEVAVAPNGTVKWINEDTVIHTVTSGSPRHLSGYFDSGLLQAGGTFNHTFSKAGVYDYYSTINPYMLGKVIAGFNAYNLIINGRTYPISFQVTGEGNQMQRITLQTTAPFLEIRMLSPSPGNLTLIIPRIILDKLDLSGKDDAFGIVGNRPIGFNESSTTPSSRSLVIEFDKGVNYIQILGTKSLQNKISQNSPALPKVNTKPTEKAEGIDDLLKGNMISQNLTGNMSGNFTEEPKPTSTGDDVTNKNQGVKAALITIVPGSSSSSNGNFYVPDPLSISKGTTVTWTNDDTILHTVTSGRPEDVWESGHIFDSYLAAGKTFTYNFESTGTFDYHCVPHPFMTGRVIVT